MLDDIYRAICSVRPIGTCGAVRAGCTIRSGKITILATRATRTEVAANARSTAETAATALGVAVDSACDDGFGNDGDVATIASFAAITTVATEPTVAASAAIGKLRFVIGIRAATPAGTASASIAASTTIPALTTAGIDMYPHDEIIDLDGNVAAVFPGGAFGAARTEQTVAATLAVMRRVVAIPVIDPVSTFLTRLTRLAGRALSTWGSVGALRDDVRHLRSSSGWRVDERHGLLRWHR